MITTPPVSGEPGQAPPSHFNQRGAAFALNQRSLAEV